MINQGNPAGQSGSINPFALTVAAIAIFALGMGAGVLVPASASPSATPDPTTYAGPGDYFPDQFVNRSTEIIDLSQYD